MVFIVTVVGRTTKQYALNVCAVRVGRTLATVSRTHHFGGTVVVHERVAF